MTSFMRPAVAALAVLCCVTSPARSRAEETPVHKDATSRASAVPQGTPIYFSGVPGKPRDFAIVGTGRNASEAHASAPERTSNPSVDVKQAPSLTANRLTTSVAVSNVALCTAAFDQTQPVLVQDSAGGYFLIWTDYRYGTTQDIFAQELNGAGAREWGLDGNTVCKSAGFQTTPKIVADGLGGSLSFWQDDRNGNLDIYMQRLNANGQPLLGPAGVALCTAAGDQRLAAVIGDGVNGAIVCWEDDRAGATSTDVYVQRVNNSGTALWTPDGVAVGAAAGQQLTPVLVSDLSSGAIIAWQDGRVSPPDIYAQRVNASGSPQWTANGVAVCNASGSQSNPSICTDGAGGAEVAWDDARTPANGLDVYAQRVNASGTPQWTANGVALVTATGDQKKPQCATDGASGIVVGWQDFRGGATADIYARRVDAAGTLQWTANGVAVCTAATDQSDLNVTSEGGGGVFFAWTDARDNGTTGTDIYAQKLNSSGTALWTANGVALCNTAGNQDQPSVEADGVGGAFVVWRDFRSGSNYDIYGQRVSSGGNPDQCVAPVDLVSGTSVAAAGPSNNYAFNMHPVTNPQTAGTFYWTAIGVRGASGDDWDMEVYAPGSYGLEPYPTCFGNPVAGSYEGPGVVDFVIGNFNDFHVVPDNYDARASRYSGSGAATVEWDDGPDVLAIDPAVFQHRTTDSTDVLECWDTAQLTGGQTYTIQFRRTGGTALTRVLLFQSFGSVGCSPTDCFYMVPRSARVIEAEHDFTFTSPNTEFYGIVVVNDNGQSGTYDIKVVSGIPTTDVGSSPLSATGLKGMVPNPAKGSVMIQFALGKPGSVAFQVFDIGGRVVSNIPAKDWSAGTWTLAWNGRGADGHRALPGLYFVQMKVDDRVVGLDRVTLLN